MKPEHVSLTQEECEKISSTLNREPNEVEWQLFSSLWSEHCSYKSSKKFLEQLPRDYDSVLVKAGESNAGVINLDNGWAITFKLESHNHPSAIAPFQGAATGVGGILRDILAMGARPLILMNSLRFGTVASEKNAKTQKQLEQVVSGISYYGNCVGLANVGGEVFFDACYSENPLVNVFCLGIMPCDQIQNNRTIEAGDLVVYFGARTRKEGLAGADFASRELVKEEKAMMAIQIGDAFAGKRLIEGCLEVYAKQAVIAVQDMGAAGLACSSAELALRCGQGIRLDLDQVPTEERGLKAHEILLSESQERMVFIAKSQTLELIQKIGKKWDLEVAVVGEITAEPYFEVCFQKQLVAHLPLSFLVTGAPLKEEVAESQKSFSKKFQVKEEIKIDYYQSLLQVISLPSLRSKRSIFEQFDFLVGNNTEVVPGSDAAVIRLRCDSKEIFLAMTLDGNGWYCSLDPYLGTQWVVAEAARNLICSGAQPLAVTNNLNLGNPQKPEKFWEFQQVVKGLAQGCAALNIPVISGNVSFYNETAESSIYPTPVIGMVGKIEKQEWITTSGFKKRGDAIALIGEVGKNLNGSYFQKEILKTELSSGLTLDWEKEKGVYQFLKKSFEQGWIQSAHDCSEGGLALTLVESCLANSLGAEINLSVWNELSWEEILFNEEPSRVVISFDPKNLNDLRQMSQKEGVPFTVLGRVESDQFVLQWQEERIIWPLKVLSKHWNQSFFKAHS